MILAFVGPGVVDGRDGPVWSACYDVIEALGRGHTLVHTGGDGVGGKVASIYRRARPAERRRFPAVEVLVPDVARHGPDKAYQLNAAALLFKCDVVAYVGYGEDAEVAPLLAQAALAPHVGRVRVYSAEEFVAVQTARGRA